MRCALFTFTLYSFHDTPPPPPPPRLRCARCSNSHVYFEINDIPFFFLNKFPRYLHTFITYEAFSCSPIEDPAIPFAVSLTSNPITLLDGLRIRIFQKAKLAHFPPCVFSSFLPRFHLFCSSASHSLVLLRSSLSAVIVFFLSLRADVEIPFRCSNSFISRRAGSLIFFLFYSGGIFGRNQK